MIGRGPWERAVDLTISRRRGELPDGFSIKSMGTRGLVLFDRDMPLLTVLAPQHKRRRICVCLIYAAGYLDQRAKLKAHEMAALRDRDTHSASFYSKLWIDAQRDYDRACSLALGRLGARKAKKNGRKRHG